MQDGQECIQTERAVDATAGRGLLHESVLHDHREAEQRELELLLSGGPEYLFDGVRGDAVGQVLLGHLSQQVVLVDEAVVDGDVEGGECALEIGHHQKHWEGDSPLVARHQGQSHPEGHVGLTLVYLPAGDHQRECAPQPRPVHGLLCGCQPGVGRFAQHQLLRKVDVSV